MKIIKNKKLLVPLLVIVLLVVLSIWFFRYRTSGVKLHPQTPTSAGASADNQKGQPAAQAQPVAANDSNQPGDAKNNNSTSGNADLLAPTGNFVSNHRPGQNNSPLSETSVCTTSPGAVCQIVFTNNGVTRSLPSQTTDRAGSTFWNGWTPTSVGLTAGSWQVQAKATLGNQTKVANDQMELIISQ